MFQRFKERVLINPGENRVVARKEHHSQSAYRGLQPWWLFIKMRTGWRLQYLFEMLYRKNEKRYFAYENRSNHEKPLVYSCSGCSGAAQMANYLAVQLDRKGMAEMSCIAGVGGNVKKLVRTAFSGRPIITIDGCPLACSRACLGNLSIMGGTHFELSAMGVKKMEHEDFDHRQADKILSQIQKKIGQLAIAS